MFLEDICQVLEDVFDYYNGIGDLENGVVRFIGNARLNTAVCRPKLIGGERAKYAVENDACNL